MGEALCNIHAWEKLIFRIYDELLKKSIQKDFLRKINGKKMSKT